MGLLESLEEDEKALAELEIDPNDKLLPEAEAEEPEAEVEAKEESEEKIEAKAEEEKPLNPAEAAYWRRKQREADAKIADLERRLTAAPVAPVAPTYQAPIKTESSTSTEPDKNEDLAGWLVWNAEDQRKWRDEETTRQTNEQRTRNTEELINRGYQEIEVIETNYKKTNPDYDNALAYAESEYARSAKMLNPRITDAQIKEELRRGKLEVAIHCTKNNLVLGDVLYDAAIERFGYNPESTQSEARSTKSPNLKVISNNKKRAASSLEGGGQSRQGRITLEAAADMSPGELAALSADDWNYLKTKGF